MSFALSRIGIGMLVGYLTATAGYGFAAHMAFTIAIAVLSCVPVGGSR